MPGQLSAQQNDEAVSKPSPARIAGYHADLRELGARIKAEHPRPFRVITETDFDALIEREVAQLTENSTRADFLWAMSHVIASIGCGHSALPFFNQQNQEISITQRFPAKVRFHAGRLYVTDPMTNSDSLSKGQEIVAINGISVPQLRETIFARITADVHLPTAKDLATNVYATAYLTYALEFPERYAVTLRGQAKPLTLKPLNEFASDPVLSPLDPCQEELCYERDETRNIGIATLNRLDYYGGERADRFVAWWAEVMEDLTTNDRSGLLIDMRGVLGGSGNAGSYILRHLTDQPFKFYSANSDKRGRESLFLTQEPIGQGYNGEVYILIDGMTYSAAPHLFAIAQSNGIATLIGAPAGGGKSTNDGKLRFTSTNEDVEYFVARMIFEVEAPELGIDEGVEPDITLTYSLTDTLDRTDSMRDRAVDLLGIAASRL
ncbi:hypothetical protein EH31_02040 [Erythrobacter longus]|uniref:Tail specific protease domain-containing protein n=2 Tax=Erythrobacter longus TaxID=1044 RepID=A0A074MF98_ERYLO|nr:hypothetical protein EH31_02040 [Erythrobacter longus]